MPAASCGEAARDQGRPIAGNNYPVLDGIKPGERVVDVRRAEARRRRADPGRRRDPASPAQPPAAPRTVAVFATTFIRRPILASVCALVIILAG
jgi:hypothetical protein